MRTVDVSRFDADGAGEAEGSIFGLPYSASESSLVLIPVPWEPTVSYGRGTAGGPEAIREASRQLDLYDPELAELGLARPWTFGLHMFPQDRMVHTWNERACSLVSDQEPTASKLEEVNVLGRELDAWVQAEASAWRARDKIVGVVGGDHSVAMGAICAAAEEVPTLGILHVDAHADLRVAYEGFERSHASVMHNVLATNEDVQLVQVGVRDLSAAEARRCAADPRIETFFDHRVRQWIEGGRGWDSICEEIVGSLPEHVYISFDIDGLDPALCPHTGTPVPGGLGFGQAMSLLRTVVTSGRRIVGFDLVEVAPAAVGGRAQWDGNVGARILHRLCGASLLSQGARDRLDPEPDPLARANSGL